MRWMLLGALFLLALSCAGCGSAASSPPNRVVLKLSTGSAGAGAVPTIGDLALQLTLPPGVSVAVASDGSGQTAEGVVAVSGTAAAPNTVALAKYSAVTGLVTLQIVKSDGFPPGEFATVTCDVAPGASPASAGFDITDFAAFDLAGNAISGLAAAFHVEVP
ncbi:hypothetical protein [Geomesophilobacter sediminis]|uniref:Lipoprotein n=1 Tax=Geomesophilobacter sediminis TaxID=2798584 RepID=A0A8J7INX1_9BACT|nr:hypothetical protein [Geomesophilobacter sediminis]MBJ6725073.1 hypothetical protein [Geomesophilobacter sediminis]